MLHMTPGHIPPLQMMLDDIGNPSTRKIAKALGVSERTVCGWKARGTAPRPAMLALFWLTRWGASAVNCAAHNDAVHYAGMVGCLEREISTLKTRLESVGRLGDFGSANDPAPGIQGPGPATQSLVFPPIQFPEQLPEEPRRASGPTTGATAVFPW